jgi:LemA protein
MDTTIVILLIVLGVILLAFILTYNKLVSKKNYVENVFASLDALLKKRYDLIPNLVSTVQQYMKHERELLTEITETRTKALSGNIASNEAVEYDNKLTNLMGRLMVSVENYPDLKASQNFLNLQGSLNEVEEQIAAGRRSFNARVMDYNNAIEMFPSSLVARMIGYQRKQFFEIPQHQRENVDVGNMFQK